MFNYGESLKYQREIAGLSILELAKNIGTSHQNISRWERGEVIPNVDFCVQLANFYGITLDELLGISDEVNLNKLTAAAPMGESITAEERKIIEDYRNLNKSCKTLVKDTIKTLLGTSGSVQKKIN